MTALHIDVAIAGVGWLTFGVCLYIAYRHGQGLDLTTTTKVAIPRPAVDTEAEYESVLVAFDERGYVPELMATAARMAARRRRGIHVLVTISVPSSSPIDAALPEQESAAASIIEEAKVQVGRRVSGHVEMVRAGQTGRRIVDEARAMHAGAIVMPMARAGRLRPDARNRAPRATLPRDHRVASRQNQGARRRSRRSLPHQMGRALSLARSGPSAGPARRATGA